MTALLDYLQGNTDVGTPTLSVKDCKLLPGDHAWPKKDVWNAFNSSVDGRLIKTIPIGAACHTDGFDEEKCQFVRDHWREPELHLPSSSSVMDFIFANKSCDPFTDKEDQCVIGAYVQYSVNVTRPEHVMKTIEFVKNHDIRFVVRNTGHDYMGRSTGTGAVSVWMYHSQGMEWVDEYTSKTYSGPAVKVQAGVMGYQIAEEAKKRGLVVVVGECPTVGFAGGYVQGGGHSFITNLYGLAADQTLSFEVITTDGRLVTASPTENKDLYWALSGGGGGTYGVVWSVTIRAFPDLGATAAYLSFNSQGLSRQDWWSILSAWQRGTPNFTDQGIFVSTAYNFEWFQMAPLFAPNHTVESVTELMKPILSLLESNQYNIKYHFSIEYHQKTPVSSQEMNNMISEFQFGGRLLPRSLWESEEGFEAFMETVKVILEAGCDFIWDVALRPTLAIAGYPDNAVHPAWRNAERMFNPTVFLDYRASIDTVIKNQDRISQVYDEPLRQLTPEGGGAYMNEADYTEPDWKDAFYGSNYDRLLAIKDKWDPDQILYGSIAVGGDRWQERKDGRLCRSKSSS
ncbi:hypothetical protein GYMLUDRAFT_171811 [Collybiopsis luxurians FD-317 M1]|uniref:FAD-binding PCMH-type domain-containing protein n=1 Tax=Collybiopsis luxurians FD-317 M1 TaxID=944289 RepID=A0A0D0CIE6_9AGAR|nr:hypothetical protein GYMLUDRAFT_171811 [Collybiopsis luxurians FD-317 M1]